MKMKCKRQVLLPYDLRYKFLNKLTKTVLKQSSAGEEIKNVLNKATKFISCEACFLRVNFILFANNQLKKITSYFQVLKGLLTPLFINFK